MTGSLRWVRLWLVLAVGLVPLPPTPLAAQTTPGDLDRVEALVDAGDAEGARRALEGWWDRVGEGAPREEFQRALWLRALLTLEADRAELDYRRLVLEYPGGPWSDRALFRLAQAAEARGDRGAAGEHLQRLLRDYPASSHLEEARRMLARPAPSGSWAVQLGAFSSSAGAREVAERARAAGFEPRLVRTPGTDLVRVRLGTFPDESAARGLLQQVRARGLEATVVDDAHRESPAG